MGSVWPNVQRQIIENAASDQILIKYTTKLCQSNNINYPDAT